MHRGIDSGVVAALEGDGFHRAYGSAWTLGKLPEAMRIEVRGFDLGEPILFERRGRAVACLAPKLLASPMGPLMAGRLCAETWLDHLGLTVAGPAESWATLARLAVPRADLAAIAAGHARPAGVGLRLACPAELVYLRLACADPERRAAACTEFDAWVETHLACLDGRCGFHGKARRVAGEDGPHPPRAEPGRPFRPSR